MSAQPHPVIRPLVPPPRAPQPGVPNPKRSVIPTNRVRVAPPQTKAVLDLVIEDEDGGRYVHPLNGDVLKIGRRMENDVVLSSPHISGFHAEIRRLDSGEFEVVDSRSFNGTAVNGKRISRQVLKAEDVVHFGSVEARIQAASQAAAPEPVIPKAEVPPVQLSGGAQHLQIASLREECQRLVAEQAKLKEARDTRLTEIQQLQKERCRAEELTAEAHFQLKKEKEELAKVRERIQTERQNLEALLAELGQIKRPEPEAFLRPPVDFPVPPAPPSAPPVSALPKPDAVKADKKEEVPPKAFVETQPIVSGPLFEIAEPDSVEAEAEESAPSKSEIEAIRDKIETMRREREKMAEQPKAQDVPFQVGFPSPETGKIIHLTTECGSLSFGPSQEESEQEES